MTQDDRPDSADPDRPGPDDTAWRRVDELFAATTVAPLAARPGTWEAVVGEARSRRRRRRFAPALGLAAGLALLGILSAVVVQQVTRESSNQTLLPPAVTGTPVPGPTPSAVRTPDPSSTPDPRYPGATVTPDTVPPSKTLPPTASPAFPVPGCCKATVAAPAILLVLRDDGLGYAEPTTAARRASLPFGAPADNLRALMGSAFRTFDEQPFDSCLPGVRSLRSEVDGFQVLVKDDRFYGWSVDTGAQREQPTTADGLGVGTTLEQLRADYPDLVVTETPNGAAFTAGGLRGMLTDTPTGTTPDPGAPLTVGVLSAGGTCPAS